ncbi:TIGR01244 family phosphatase [Qipengyuania sp. 1NDH17]|uniref:TIGR01244 family phosphatase n=1 Tax=Qipengyuania polymorpha TaxID=2867234 RepID=A0ABS7J4A0_9SPHN|nr:TIGR01244 family sulfur transferase [Qipengyuania polymorpha]MBX7458889.1 TIGR01244 family phosphatase [Qipengyuania polymorpha]
MSQFKQLTEKFWASPQIDVADVETAKAEGFTHIICNRPDSEAPDQPSAAEIGAAARQLGMGFSEVPVSSAGFSLPQVDAMQDALAKGGDKVLGYCRSGTRSTLLWAMVQAKAGADLDDIEQKASAAGYSTSAIRPTMEMLAKGG